MSTRPQRSIKNRGSGTRRVFAAAVIIGLLCGGTAGAFLSLTRDLPQIQSLENFKPSAITRVYSADNVLLAELYIERRDPVPLAMMPAALKAALLTTEDRKFYRHNGIDIKGILRAAVKNVMRGRLSEGASTLTQQLAKTLFLTPRKTFLRKLKEAVLALQLERRYTKDEILALYLNQIYLGSGAYGVAAAARTYFNKPVQDLNLAECALIAGLPQAPSRYSPLVDPDAALKRRNIVLRQMLATGAIDETTYRQTVVQPIIAAAKNGTHVKAHFFIKYVKRTLEKLLGDNLVYKGGLTVYTTLVERKQTAAEAAVSTGLEALGIRMAHNGYAHPTPQAALIALDVRTGSILSMVGGSPGQRDGFNRTAEAERQPGSAFKPIVYALAVERGFSQTQTLLDAPVVFDTPYQHDDWQPENFDQHYTGEISLRWALAHSKNIPAVRLIEKIGPSSVVQFAHTLGITSELRPNLSLALGSSETRLLELTGAYEVFANRGKYTSPYGIMEIRNDEGKVIWRARPAQHIAMSRASAAIVTDMLTAVVNDGTGQQARRLRGPIAGKTGTTNEYRDALFIGYSPTIVTGVWVGNDDNSSLGPYETGARAALPIWIAFMEQALADQPQTYFDIPDDTRQITIDPKSGQPLPAEMRAAVKVLVKKG